MAAKGTNALVYKPCERGTWAVYRSVMGSSMETLRPALNGAATAAPAREVNRMRRVVSMAITAGQVPMKSARCRSGMAWRLVPGEGGELKYKLLFYNTILLMGRALHNVLSHETEAIIR